MKSKEKKKVKDGKRSALDLLTEDLKTIAEVPSLCPKVPGRKRPHVTTVNRWINRGINGTKLEAIKIGAVRFTSTQAVTRFFKEINGVSA